MPVPDERTNGSYVKNLDFDVQDERWNGSGLAWHELYHQHNYPRLQAVKARGTGRRVPQPFLRASPLSRTPTPGGNEWRPRP